MSLYKTQHTKNEVTQIKRLITEAGRIQVKLAPELERLDALKGQIKTFMTEMADAPNLPGVLVSGEFVAELSAEREQRTLDATVNSKVFHLVGVKGFMELVKLQLTATKKAIGIEKLDMIAPPSYQGKGRSFKLVPKG